MMECFYIGGMLLLSTGNGLDDAVINVNRVDYFQQMPDNQAKIQFSSSGILLEKLGEIRRPHLRGPATL